MLSTKLICLRSSCISYLTHSSNYSTSKRNQANKSPYKEHGTKWIESFVNNSPKSIHPYLKLMRLDRPIGTWLVYLPCTWGIALATPFGEWPSLTMLAMFGTGALLMRGAGCTINDLWDRDFDKHVDRTRSRPITSGNVSINQAIGFVGLLSLPSLLILLQFNYYSILLGLASSGLVITYPLFKRYTNWPQVALGFAFNWGAMLGYSAVAGCCYWPIVLPSYIAGLCWTLVYDTIYALQDIDDDIKLGLKSTAIYFGDNCKPWLSLFGTGMGSLLMLTGVNSDAGPIYFAGISAAMLHIAYQIYTLRVQDRMHCLELFKANRNTGLLIFLSIALDKGLGGLFDFTSLVTY